MFSIQISEFESYCREQLNLSEHSLRAYAQDLRAFGQFTASDGIETTPTAEDLVRYHRHLRESIGASPATIRRRFVTLRSYFRWLEEERAGQMSPFRGLRLELKVPKRLPRPVDRQTLGALLKSSRRLVEIDLSEPANWKLGISSDQITGLLARVLIATGLRIGEITNLRLRDVSGACSQIRVRGKGNRERTVFVANARLLQDFRFHCQQRIKVARPDDYLFLNSRGDRLTEAAFRKRLRATSNSLQIAPHLTPHRFRHSAATMLIEEGVDIRLVQRLLGHASIATTELYTKVSDNSLIAAIERADTLAQVDP